MPQELGHEQAGIEPAHTTVHQLLPRPGGISVPEPVVGHGAGGASVLDRGPDLVDVLLELADCVVCLHIVRDKQLMPPGRHGQKLLQLQPDIATNRDGANLPALPLDGDGVLPQRLFGNGGVDAETLMDAQTSIPGDAGNGGIVIPAIGQTSGTEPGIFIHAPGPVHAAEPTPLQVHAQIIVGGKMVFRSLHLIMEEPDRGQVGFDGGGGHTLLLHIDHVSGKVLAVDVGQFLQMEVVSQKAAKAFHGVIVPLLGLEAPLPIVPGGLVQLGQCQRQSKIVRKRRRNFVVFRRGWVTKSAAALLKKSVHDLLFLTHKFLAFFQTVGLALDVNDSAVMQDAVQDGGGDGDVGKDLVPLGEGLVGGKTVDVFS